MAKGQRAPAPHHTRKHAARPLDLVQINTAGPYLASLGGSWYAVMFIDSAQRLQRPYGTREKSESAFLPAVKRFVADIDVRRVAFYTLHISAICYPPIHTAKVSACTIDTIPASVCRKLPHEAYVEMPVRTRGKTCAMYDTLRGYAHRHGILSTMDHAALVPMHATRWHNPPKSPPDLLNAPTSDSTTSNNVLNIEKSPGDCV